MSYRFALGVLLGAAAAVLSLYHAGPVELALFRGSVQVSSAVVHLLLIVSGIVIGWILHDERPVVRGAGDSDARRDAA
jgi:uncharacterized integral membrane protein